MFCCNKNIKSVRSNVLSFLEHHTCSVPYVIEVLEYIFKNSIG